MEKSKDWHDLFNFVSNLGKGGNAQVYSVREKTTGSEFALKELCHKTREKEARFIDEIYIAKENASIIPGIVPIINFCEDEYWYTMPIVISIQDYIANKEISEIVLGVIQLSETLEKLHEKGISHRDIKPSNIYIYNGRFALGDFGLVDFPDRDVHFTRSDRGLGAIFTIAPEMKRDPKHADGKKADIFSLAKTTWMLISGNTLGFDGVYNYRDPSHSLRFIEKYRNTHLVELDELLADATANDPNLRPSMMDFKKRLKIWLDIYSDDNKSQGSDWNFLNKQLFGSNCPSSSVWRNINDIVNALNVIGMTPAYNHMLFSDGGGLDFLRAELANETSCINIYDTIGFCLVVKPKCLCYEGFDEGYRWNYFLLELDSLDPIFEEEDLVSYERLVEDTPAHYVSSKYAQYGVYDYDTEAQLPEGYRIVRRYNRGKILIVMKNGPYNHINGTYDGRHGQCSNSDFRNYIEKLEKKYSTIYEETRKNDEFNDISDDELERRILNLECFNSNPFNHGVNFLEEKRHHMEMRQQRKEQQKIRDYMSCNYDKWNFKEILKYEEIASSPIKFYFEFEFSDYIDIFSKRCKWAKYICKDGSIKEMAALSKNDLYYVYNRTEAVRMKNVFQQAIDKILCENNLRNLDVYRNYISIEFEKCGKPTHLFTKQEIEKEMKQADDRHHNQLVIDEDGYARVIKDEGDGHLFPVRHETWDAGNVYVGKYSKLSTLDDNYISSLQGWLAYLETGQEQYIDYIRDDMNEDELLEEIKKYY